MAFFRPNARASRGSGLGLTRGVLALAAVAPLAFAGGCKKDEAHPPVTDDPNRSGGGSVVGDDGGSVVSGDGGAGVLATFGAAVRHLAIDSTLVYATIAPTLDSDAGGDAGPSGSIVAVPRNGGAPVTIESGGAPDAILVAGNFLVWSDSSGAPGQSVVYRASLSTAGAASPVASGLEGPVTFVSDGTNVFFASNIVGASGITVDRAGLAGGGASNVTTVAGELTAGPLVTDGTSLYVAANGLAGGEVVRVPAGGGPVDVIWSSPSVHAIALAFAAGTVYIAAGATGTDGGLIAVHVAAPATTTPLGSGSFTPTAMALDGSFAYMTVVASGNGALARFALSGGDPVSLADGLGAPVDLVVADGAYVGTASSLVRLAK